MYDEIQLPDVEIIVRAASFDVAVIAFFRREDMFEGYDVVSGISSTKDVGAICTALQDAIKSLSSHSWKSVHDVYLDADETGDGVPF